MKKPICRLCQGTGQSYDSILLRKQECPRCEGTGMGDEDVERFERQLREDFHQEVWSDRNEWKPKI
jgi:DnaJ-class molecular chaperone